MAKYKYVGNKNPATNYTTEIVLKADSDGTVVESIPLGGSGELSDAQFKSLGEVFILEKESGYSGSESKKSEGVGASKDN